MGRQVAIAGTSDDIRQILAAAEAEGARAVTERVPPDDPPDLHHPQELFRRQPDRKLYLLPGDLAAVEVMATEVMGSPGTATVNSRTTPAVELSPSRVQDGSLRTGRLYLGISPSDTLYEPAKRLYDALVKSTEGWARTTQYDVRVGPEAERAARNGSLQIESDTGEPLTLK